MKPIIFDRTVHPAIRLMWGLAWAVALAALGAVAVFAFTDVSPYMHEVIWQHSWKPVCAQPDGTTRFC